MLAGSRAGYELRRNMNKELVLLLNKLAGCNGPAGLPGHWSAGCNKHCPA